VITDICDVCVEKSKFRECVAWRLVARGDGAEGTMLVAAGTLLKGGKRFLEIRIFLVTLLRNSIPIPLP
jgi:hypothetical protein